LSATTDESATELELAKQFSIQVQLSYILQKLHTTLQLYVMVKLEKRYFLGTLLKCTKQGDIATWQYCFDPLWCKLYFNDIIGEKLLVVYKAILNCSPKCSRRYIQHINDCRNVPLKDDMLQGHPVECYITLSCNLILLYLLTLAVCFPDIRYLVQMIYTVQKCDENISTVENALWQGDVKTVSIKLLKMLGA